jgi:hypothetical protein
MRRKIARLDEALVCSFFTHEHEFALQMMPNDTGHHSARAAEPDEKIDSLCEPYERQPVQLAVRPKKMVHVVTGVCLVTSSPPHFHGTGTRTPCLRR